MFIECVCRFVIILLEDVILYLDVVLLTWFMCATSKGFESTDVLCVVVVCIVGEMVVICIKDSVLYGVVGDLVSGMFVFNDVEVALSAVEVIVV